MRIVREECTGLVVDLQERLFRVMDGKEELERRCRILLEGLGILGVPLLATEQYPEGLGPTIASIREILHRSETIEKISFSCCGEPHFLSALEKLRRRKVIICGIEAHVCVLQTVTDLAEKGYVPVVVTDCISSRNAGDREVAIERMRMEGAVVTTTESILFELAGVAGTGEFKSISRLVK